MKASATSTAGDFASIRLAASLLLLGFTTFAPLNDASAQALCAQGDVGCRPPRAGQVIPPPPAGRPAALLDLEGQWVSVVTEDWRSYMLTAPKGDYESMPLNGIGRQVADAWNPDATDTDACMAYGAASIMRMPSRFRIAWESDDVLKIETDAGMQVRKLHFTKSAGQQGAPSRQGYSAAKWVQEGEAVDKKSAFQRQAKIELGLSNVTVFNGRVEAMPGGRFDVVISRAFADLTDFVRVAGHLAAPYGRLYAMKGLASKDEARCLPSGWVMLDCARLSVPGLDAQRHLIVLERL